MAGIGINLLHSPVKEELRSDLSLSAGNIADLTAQCGFIQKFSAKSLWLTLVSMMRFWYEAEILSAGKEITASRIEPELAFLGETVFVPGNAIIKAYAPTAPHRQEYQSVEVPLVGKLLGLGPNAELRIGTENGEVSVVSGSVYPMSCVDYRYTGCFGE